MPDHHPDTRVPDQAPPDPLPSIEHDLGIVEWLQCSQGLSSETTGYLCDALLQWALLGGQWPEAVEPEVGVDELEVLTQLHTRWLERALAAPVGRRLELARVGRALGVAIRCERDPEGLVESQWREMVHLQPSLAQGPAPYVLPHGRVL